MRKDLSGDADIFLIKMQLRGFFETVPVGAPNDYREDLVGEGTV